MLHSAVCKCGDEQRTGHVGVVWTGRRVFSPCILRFEGRIFGLLEGKEVIITAALMRGDTEHGPWVTNQDSANSSSK